MARRGAVAGLREVQALDDEARVLRARVEATRAERTRLSKEIGAIRRDDGQAHGDEGHGFRCTDAQTYRRRAEDLDGCRQPRRVERQ